MHLYVNIHVCICIWHVCVCVYINLDMRLWRWKFLRWKGRYPGKHFVLIRPFPPLAFGWLDEAHPPQGGQSASLSLPILVLMASRNTLQHTPRITMNQMSWHPGAQSQWSTQFLPGTQLLCDVCAFHIFLPICSLSFYSINSVWCWPRIFNLYEAEFINVFFNGLCWCDN